MMFYVKIDAIFWVGLERGYRSYMITQNNAYAQFCQLLCQIHRAIRAWLGLKDTDCKVDCGGDTRKTYYDFLAQNVNQD